jgi:hypothetical protein
LDELSKAVTSDQNNDDAFSNFGAGSTEQHIPDFELVLPDYIPEEEPPPSSAGLPNVFALPKAEQRTHPRYLVNWRIAIVNKSDGSSHTYYGRAYDVSLSGANIHSEYNLNFSDSVILLLSMPTRTPGKQPKIIEVSGKSLYTILMANSPIFRMGFSFANFKSDNRRELEQYLSSVPRVTSWGG